MPSTVVVSTANLVSNSNNSKYQYNFPTPVNLNGKKIALTYCSLFYSWFNITSTYQNNSFSYIWPNGASTTTYTVTVPNGSYAISDLQNYLESVMITNGTYLLTSSNNYVYYLEMVSNATQYCFEIIAYAVPTAAQAATASYTQPSSATWSYPSTATTPQLVIPTGNITTLLGFSAATYPSVSQSTTYSVNGSTPEISPVSSIQILCSAISSKYANPSTTLYSFSSAGTAFGGTITVSPPILVWNDCVSGTYSSISISFVDQNNNAMVMQDDQMNMLLTLADAAEISAFNK